MKRLKFGALTAIALAFGVTACERAPQAEQPSSESSEVAAAEVAAAESALLEANSESSDAGDFTSSLPTVPQQATTSPLGLANRYNRSNTSSTRPPRVVTAGRSNPFYAVHQPRVQVTYEEVAAESSTTNQPTTEASATESSPFPEVPQQGLQPTESQSSTAEAVPAVAFGEPAPVPSVVQPLPQPVALAPVPPTVLPVPSVPPLAAPVAVPALVAPVSQTAIAEAIEIKGLIQVGEQFNLIIKDPAAETSRTVQVGDVIGGGRVRISRIDALDSQEPQVVLEQDGIEVVRAIGV